MKAEARTAPAVTASEHTGTPPVVLAALGAVLLIWGAGYVFARVAAVNTDPLLAGVLRTVLAGLVLAPLLLLFRVKPPSGTRDRLILFAAALSGSVGWPLLLSVAAGSTTASRIGLISAASPIFVALLAVVTLGERFGRLKSGGVLVALVGVIWLLTSRSDPGLAAGEDPSVVMVRLHLLGAVGEVNYGDLVMLLATMGVSVNYVGASVLARTYPAWMVTAYSLVIGAALLLVPFLIWGLAPAMEVEAAAWTGIVYLAFISNLVGGSLCYWALARGRISRLGAFQFLQPVVVVILAAIFLAEGISMPMVFASVLILGGVYLVQR